MDKDTATKRRNSAWWKFVKPQARQQSYDRALSKKPAPAPMKVLQEVRIDESKDETKVGDRVLVGKIFKAGELVDVSGRGATGKGFAGGVKRWHYRGGDANPRLDVSIAPPQCGIGRQVSFPIASAFGRTSIFPGSHGKCECHAAKNLKVVKVDSDENLLLGCDGSRCRDPSGTYIFIRRAKNAKKG